MARKTATPLQSAPPERRSPRRPAEAPQPAAPGLPGRERSEQFLREFLETPGTTRLLHLFGPPGIGKSALLERCRALCREQGLRFSALSARGIGDPPLLVRRLGEHLARGPQPAGDAGAEPLVLAIDDLGAAGSDPRPLREALLEAVPDRVRVVAAGRAAPSADPEGPLDRRVRSHPLGLLPRAAAVEALERRGVRRVELETLAARAGGLPLALALLAEFTSHPAPPGAGASLPEPVRAALADRLLDGVDDPLERSALHVAAAVRVVNERLLRRTLAIGDAHELFDRLSRHTALRPVRGGAELLAVFREALLWDLRRRDPEREGEIVERALEGYRRDGGSGSRARAVARVREALHLFREHPLVRRHLDLGDSGASEAGPPLEGEGTTLARLAAGVDGRSAVAPLRYWLARQPQGFHVLRDGAGRVLGFSLVLDLSRLSEADLAADSVVCRAREHLERLAPLREGESASLLRVLAAREDAASPGAVRSELLIDALVRWHAMPQLAYSFALVEGAAVGRPLAEAAGFPLLFELPRGGGVLAMHGRDWRGLPRTAWTDALVRTGLGHAPLAAPDPGRLLDRGRFAAAVREALKSFARPDGLRASPLLASRLVLARAGAESDVARRTAVLRGLLEEACDGLRAHPRDHKFHEALSVTYLRPAPTQEAASERLGVPFGTYRYRLTQGVERVAVHLWRLELDRDGERPAAPGEEGGGSGSGGSAPRGDRQEVGWELDTDPA